jgi:hypothetical protein
MAYDPKDTPPPGPGDTAPPDLLKERDHFLQSFAKGGRLTEDFLQEYEKLRRRLRELEQENAALRAKVEADAAVRELVSKIDQLEREKRDLLSRYREAEAVSTEFSARFQEVETQFANLANLFVASSQLHSSLTPRGVTRRIKEVLAQLVGAESYCVYLTNTDSTELVPIASEGVPGDRLVNIRVNGSGIGNVVQKGVADVREDRDTSRGSVENPAAVVPLTLDEKVVGVIAIFATLAQKTRFDTIDFELFKLLGQHAAAALVSASLFAQAERRIPGLEAFLDLSV